MSIVFIFRKSHCIESWTHSRNKNISSPKQPSCTFGCIFINDGLGSRDSLTYRVDARYVYVGDSRLRISARIDCFSLFLADVAELD